MSECLSTFCFIPFFAAIKQYLLDTVLKKKLTVTHLSAVSKTIGSPSHLTINQGAHLKKPDIDSASHAESTKIYTYIRETTVGLGKRQIREQATGELADIGISRI